MNNEIATFNTKLKKLMKPYNHVTILETDHDRKFFTRQGMHMNNLGKERTATGVAEEATKILMTQERIICLQWENTKDKNTGEDTTGDSAPQREDQEWEYDTTPANQETTPPSDTEHTGEVPHNAVTDTRTSGRRRKQSVTRGNNFLWTANSRPQTERTQKAATTDKVNNTN